MNRIDELFSRKSHGILSIYFTAGFPQISDTSTILQALQNSGADLIEVGMPYSDPLADGPVIQHSSSVALDNGMTIERLFEQLADCRKTVTVPLLLMGYLNPVLQYGMENFCRRAHGAGIDGIILPDLPLQEYDTDYRELYEKYHLHFIFLITPETSEERIRKIDTVSHGFIYAVSSSSITGGDRNLDAQEAYFVRLEQMRLKNPVMIGFGIRDHATFSLACRHAAGAIIGTAYINAMEHSADIAADTRQFVQAILQPPASFHRVFG